MQKFKSYFITGVICFIFGAGCVFGFGFWYFKSAENKYKQLAQSATTQINDLTNQNKQLTDTNDRLAKELTNSSRLIGNAGKTITAIRDDNQTAQDLVKQIQRELNGNGSTK